MRRMFALLLLTAPAAAFAQEPVKVAPNKADEPKIKAYSADKAVEFLDAASLDWTRRRECFSCHTNYSYLDVRPMISAKTAARDEVRTALEAMVTTRWPDKKPRWDAEDLGVHDDQNEPAEGEAGRSADGTAALGMIPGGIALARQGAHRRG